MRSRRHAVTAPLAALVLTILAVTGAAGSVDDDCALERASSARAEVTGVLGGDGQPLDVTRSLVVEDDSRSCVSTTEGDRDDLPVDVAVLHRTERDGSIEAEHLADADGPVVSRVAVRDRTATARGLTVDGPGGTERIERRVGVPQLVRVTITYPTGWSAVTPARGGARTDAVDGGVQVSRSELLFPPITGDEVVLTVTAAPGRGTPEVAVEVTPVTEGAVPSAEDALDRDAAAVVAALTEVGADGADQLAHGTAELADGLNELAGGAGQLRGGLEEAAAGGAQLRSGSDELAAGSADLAAGTQQLADGLEPLAEGARGVAEGNRQLADQLALGAEGAEQLADGSRQLAAGSRELSAGIDELATGVAALRRALDRLPDLGPITSAVVAPTAAVIGGIEEAAFGAAELAAGADAVARGSRALADQLDAAAGGSRELAAGSAQVADGAETAASGSQELAAGSQQLATGARELADGIDTYTRGIEAAAGASAELAGGADQAADGADQLASGARELPGALEEATGTADRAGARQAETTAIVEEGRALAHASVADATGGAPAGTLSTELVAAGDRPLPIALLLAIVLLIAATATVGRAWWRTREAT